MREPEYEQLVYTRESLTSEFGVCLYDYAHCEPIEGGDFPAADDDDEDRAYEKMYEFVLEWDMEFVDY